MVSQWSIVNEDHQVNLNTVCTVEDSAVDQFVLAVV